MEVAPGTSSQSSAPKPVTFFSLPAEVRLKIYELVDPNIVIYCDYQPPCSTANFWYGRGHGKWKTEVTYHTELLGVCRKMNAEASSLLEKPHVIVAGFMDGRLDDTRWFMQTWSTKVYKLILEDWRFGYLSKWRQDFGYNFFEDGNCPNLRSIEFIMPYHWDWSHQQTRELANLAFPARLLPLIRTWLQQSHLKKITGLLDLFKRACPPKWSPSHWECPVSETNALIKERDLGVSATYTFALRGRQTTESLLIIKANVLFEKRFKVLVVWDKDGVRIEELPDLSWWKEWVQISAVAQNQRRVLQISDTEGYWEDCTVGLT